MFIGREKELTRLQGELDRSLAGLIVCRGRRCIGKSRLIQEWGKSVSQFYEFQGLAPRPGMTRAKQLEHFSLQLQKHFAAPQVQLDNWFQAFQLLASYTRQGRVIIFLDEISWMGFGDPDFSGTLKTIWDTEFKKNPKLLLVLCGSAASWIEDNILKNTSFLGRVSLTLTLEELQLPACNAFWGKQASHVSSFEKLKLLSVTGGVPRYLEEIKPNLSAEENIQQLCFTKEGFLFSEFDRIIHDTFGHRAELYRRIISILAKGSYSYSEVCEKLKRPANGVMSEYLQDLTISGFLCQDKVFRPGARQAGRLSQFRLKDNYLRFYLRYIAPVQKQIEQGLYDSLALEDHLSWDTIIGLQFENLVLNSLPLIVTQLGIHSMSSILNAAPYFQRKTQRQQACQIDLLIQTKHTLYVCEIKYRQSITPKVIEDVQQKVQRLKAPKNLSIRPVLIYEGELTKSVKDADYFSTIIPFSELLK